MVLKFYLSVAKALKLQVKKSLGLNPTFVKVRKTRGKTLEGLFAPRVNKPENNGLVLIAFLVTHLHSSIIIRIN